MEITIAGKKVVLRDAILMQDGYDVLGLLMKSDMADLRTQVPLAIRTIESWEFEGDPNKPESYDRLDVLRVIIPLFRDIVRHLNEVVTGVEEAADETKN